MAAEELRNITNATASSALKKRAIRKLEVASRHACAVATQLIAASQSASATNTNTASQQQLMTQCKVWRVTWKEGSVVCVWLFCVVVFIVTAHLHLCDSMAIPPSHF